MQRIMEKCTIFLKRPLYKTVTTNSNVKTKCTFGPSCDTYVHLIQTKLNLEKNPDIA